MFYFLIRLLANALAVALTVWLLPGIALIPEADRGLVFILAYLILGLLFGLINAFVRPIVLFLTGRLLIGTMGLFILVINGLLFWLLANVIPDSLIIDEPVLLRSIGAGALIGIFVIVLEALLGLDSPGMRKDQKDRFYWRWLDRVPAARRTWILENLRLQEAYATIRRYGLDLVVGLTPFARFRRSMQRRLYPGSFDSLERSAPEKVRLMLEELGPTYVKFGQMVAGRSEILPEAWIDEFSQLQDNVASFPYEKVDAIVRQELGERPDDVYANFEHQPLAAASLGQTHEAQLPGGERVAVKVQRPGIQASVRGDLSVMENVARTVEKRAPWARDLGLSGMVGEFASNTIEEMDYRNEAYHARRLAEGLKDLEDVHVPMVYSAFSGERVLTMEFIEGIKLTDLEGLDAAGADRERLARSFLRAMNKQVLLDGFFHADPHPGNLFYEPDQDRIVFLDLGIMGQLNDAQRLALFDLMWSIKNGDTRNLTRILLQLSTSSRAIDREALERDVDHLVQRHVLHAEGVPLLSDVIQEAFFILYHYGIVLNRSLTLALKGMIQAEEVVRTLAPDLAFIDAAIDEVQEVMLGQLTPDRVAEKVKEEVTRAAKDFMVRSPRWRDSAERWIEELEKGRLTVYLDTDELNQRIERVDNNLTRVVRQMVLGILLVGMLLGTAIASTVPADAFSGLPLISKELFVIVFVVVAAISLIYVFSLLLGAWRERRQSRTDS